MEQRPSMSPRARLLAAGAGAALVAALVVAGQLTPDPRGYGTHEQLGLAACWFRGRFGLPCPTCGMTTSWAWLLRGEFKAAASASAGGVLACTATAAAASWLMATAATGRRGAFDGTARAVLWVGTIIALVSLVDWARRLITT